MITISILCTLALSGCVPFRGGDTAGSDVPAPPLGDVLVTTPFPNDVVRSPLIVEGKARGTWYFEASFPVKLYDANGSLLVAVPAQAQGDWMTEDYVPFLVVLDFPPPATPTGTLVLEKDNPSGLPEYDDSLTIPVVFQ